MSPDRLDVAGILGPGGLIAKAMPGYEARPEQLAMAEAVADAIASRSHLMVEAGTGVGKSFAYLAPAILAAVEHGIRVVVSTRTINLQEQLIHKDLPFLETVVPVEFKAVLGKGRSNYVSLRRLDAARARADGAPGESAALSNLHRWAGQTVDGTLSDLPRRPPEAVWEQVQSDGGNCLKQSCPRHRECFFFKAARRMWSSQVLVVNHALYMSDLAARARGGAILPDHDVVIFDEAHTLANVAAAHLGLRVASGAVANLLTGLDNDRTGGLLAFLKLENTRPLARGALHAVDAFFDTVGAWQMSHEAPNGRVCAPTGLPDVVVEELRKLATGLADAAGSVESPEQRVELEAARTRCEAFANDIGAWLTQDDPGAVHWIERDDGRKSTVLARAPLDLGPTLRRDLFDRVPCCIMTSATLAVGSPPIFTFSAARLGLQDVKTRHLGSPFDHDRQMTVYLADGMPDPSSEFEAYERAAIAAIPHFVLKTRGKALVLFTSHRMMREAAARLGPWFQAQGIRLLSQSSGEPSAVLIAAFRDDVDSVLFGTDTFWQGVDVPGEALSNVVITRLPFGMQRHPLLEARLEAITRQGGDRFMDYQLPKAVLEFKQGVGRLIRTMTDRGIISVLDPRVRTKPYGHVFLDSLPRCPRRVEVPLFLSIT
jgi:ATP-dependent DNA helicase DinG